MADKKSILDGISSDVTSGQGAAPTSSKGGDPSKIKFDPVSDPYSSHSPFVSSIKSYAGQAIAGAGEAGEYAGIPGSKKAEEYGKSVVNNNPQQTNSLTDIARHPLTALEEAVAPGAAYAAGALAGAKAGRTIAGAPGAAVGGILGGLAPMASANVFGNVEEQEQNGQQRSIPKAVAAAVPQTALDAFTGPERVASSVIRKGFGDFARNAGESRAKNALKHGLTSGLEEAGVEPVQNIIQQVQGGTDPTSKESLYDDVLNSAMGFVGGGVTGGAVGAIAPTKKAAGQDQQGEEGEEGQAAGSLPAPAGPAGPSAQPGTMPAERQPLPSNNYRQWASTIDPSWLSAAQSSNAPGVREAAADIRVANNPNIEARAREAAAERAATAIHDSPNGMGVNQMPPDFSGQGPLEAGLRRAAMDDVDLMDAEPKAPADESRQVGGEREPIEGEYTGGSRGQQRPEEQRNSLRALSHIPVSKDRAERTAQALVSNGIRASVEQAPDNPGRFVVHNDETQAGDRPGTSGEGSESRSRMAKNTRNAQDYSENSDENPGRRTSDGKDAVVSSKLSVEQPVDSLSLSKDVPQFKAGADERGLTEPLEGKFDRRGVAPIQVWERENGDREVISGRHRFQLAKDNGEKTIPAQIHRESQGFTADDAKNLDAELNIRDGNGSAADYASYFRRSGMSEDEATKKSLLSRAKGRTGFDIAQNASEDVLDAHRAGQITDAAAQGIANTAPGNDRLQALGISAINRGQSITQATNTMRAVSTLSAGKSDQGDMFGLDDSAMKQAQEMARIASGKQRQIKEQISSVRGSVKRPDKARELGVDVRDPEGTQKRIDALQEEANRWESWNTNPDLVEQIRSEMGEDAPAAEAAPVDDQEGEETQRIADTTGQHDAFSAEPGDRQKSMDAADRPENFSLSSEQRTDEQADDEAEAAARAGQGDMLGGQPQAAQEQSARQSDERAADQPKPESGGGLFSGLGRSESPSQEEAPEPVKEQPKKADTPKSSRSRLRTNDQIQAEADSVADQANRTEFPGVTNTGSAIDYAKARTAELGISQPAFMRTAEGKALSRHEVALRSGALSGARRSKPDQETPDAPPAPKPEASQEYGQSNKLFTKSAADEARARIRAKMGQVNSGLDPELLRDGITMAGYHIEAGARSFTDFAQRMISDFGDGIRPYLKSFYNGVRDYPGFDAAEGMDSYESVRNTDVGAIENEASSDERSPDSGNGESALAAEPAEPAQEDEGVGRPERSGDGRGEADAPGNERADERGSQRERSVGGRQGPVRARPAREGSGDAPGSRSAEESPFTPPDPSPAVSKPGPVEAGNSAPAGRLPRSKLTGDNPGNYRLSDADAIGTGTRGQRIDANIEAIEIVKRLESEGRFASKSEQAALAKYVGWGGLKRVFQIDGKSKPQDRRANERLRDLLTDEEYAAAKRSILDAHYTSPDVVRGLYGLVQHMGVIGQRVLEPSVGVGNFIGLMPEAMSNGAKVSAVERDNLTAAMAKHLYPDAHVDNAPLQKARLPYGAFDLVIGNPPFGDRPVNDMKKNHADINGFTIHNYFIARSAKHMSPGGVMGVVVTNRFLDKPHSAEREHLQKSLQFLGAVRLPNQAFAKNAGTEVTTDLVFFRKPTRESDLSEAPDWSKVVEFKNDRGETVRANEYFAQRPHLMLGTPSMGGTMYGSGEEFTLEPRQNQDLAAELSAIKESPEFAGMAGIATAEPGQKAEVQATEYSPDLNDLNIGGFALDDGKVVQRMDDEEDGSPAFRTLESETPWTEKTKLGEKRLDRIRDLLSVRNAAYHLMTAERLDAPDMEALRAELNKQYDAFQKKHGYINDSANASIFSQDIRVEFGLESNYKSEITKAKAKKLGVQPRKASADKSSLLTQRVNYPRRKVEHAANARDGYVVSLQEKGRLDLDYITGITGKPRSEVIAELTDGEKPLIYQEPESGNWIAEDEYLSGNVKAKLAAVDGLEGYEKNAQSLRDVQPEDVPAEHINANLGATWIPAEVYEDFASAIGIGGARINVAPSAGKVTISRHGGAQSKADFADYRSNLMDQAEVFNKLASGRPLVVRSKDSQGRSVVNQEATDSLRQAASAQREFFRDWIMADGERASNVAETFNRVMNTTIERKYDGSLLRLTGANPEIELRDTQASAAWRMVQDDRTLLDHVVGAGKTYTAIAGLMERRRMGLTRKPIVAVPNHKVGDWASDFLRMYPGANVLAATNKDFSAKNRRRLFARIAAGNYDAVIVGHSSFSFIPMLPENESSFIQDQLKLLEQAKREMSDVSGSDPSVRNIEQSIEALEGRIEKLMDSERDPVATIEEMGIDSITVDESHEFKNLMISTSMSNIAGMGNLKGSKKALNLFMRARLIQKQGGSTYMATGTPISNTMTEMYTVLRYMNYEALEDRNLESFDAWAQAYASVEDRVELGAGGTFRQRAIMAKFQNMPELMQMYRQFADVVTMADLKRVYKKQIERTNEERGENRRTDFPVPKVKDGGRRLDLAPPNELQEEYSEYLRMRADALQKNGRDIDPREDNMLLVLTDSRKMSMDIRMVDPQAGDYANNKTSRAAQNIKRIYDQWHADKGTQLVFSDLGTPSAYARNGSGATVKKMVGMLPPALRDKAKNVTADMNSAEAGKYLSATMQSAIEDADGGLDESLDRLQKYMDSELNEDLATLETAHAGFSVYDDLRQKLIDSGIPQNEIAFIHDYGTPKQKAELFDMVNSGQIRVLMGSTPKMGAGTNVQERVVALHHLDAPWRPSDVEQREGRAIRQGNALYEADPDGFEVEIAAYSTERTLDSMMWQTLATKQEMIGAFRNATRREMADIHDDGAGYSDFMAESTGNPVFKEQAQLKLEAKDLRARQRRIRAERASAEEQIRTYPARIKKYRSDVSLLNDAAKRLDAAESGDLTLSDGTVIPGDFETKGQAVLDKWEGDVKQYEKAQKKWAKALDQWEEAPKDTRGERPDAPVFPPKPSMATIGKSSAEAKLYSDIRERIKTAANTNQSHEETITVGGVPVLIEFTPSPLPSEKAPLKNGTVAIGYNGAEPAQIGNTSLDSRIGTHLRPKDGADRAREVSDSRETAADHFDSALTDARKTIETRTFDGEDRLREVENRLANANEEIEALEKEMRQAAQKRGNRYMGGKAHLAKEMYSQSEGPAPRNGLDVSRLRKKLRDIFGNGVERMEQSGRLTLVDSDAELPAALQGKGARGVVVGRGENGPRIYLVANRITNDNARGVFFHEVGVHFGLRNMLGDDGMADVLNQMAALRRGGDKAVNEAYGRVPEDTPEANRDEEALGYLLENAPNMPFIQRMVAKIKAWAFKTFGLSSGRLTSNDMIELAKGAARKSTREGGAVNRAGTRQGLGRPSKGGMFSQPQTTRPLGRLYDHNGQPIEKSRTIDERSRSMRPITRGEADALKGVPGVYRYSTRGPDTTGEQGWFVDTNEARQSPRVDSKIVGEKMRSILDKADARERVEFNAHYENGKPRFSYRVAAEGETATPRTQWGDPLFSVAADGLAGDSEPVDQAKADAFRRGGLYWSTLTPRERMTASMQKKWAKFKAAGLARWREGLFDRFAPIREAAGETAYLNARLSTGGSSTMYASLLYGTPEIRDGIINKKAGSKGLLKTLDPIKGEMNEWLGWMVARRAEYLGDQGRENNLTDRDIRELKRGVSGEKLARFERVAKEFREFNTDMLGLARDSGLLSQSQVDAFAKDQYYVPFYRVEEDDDGDIDPMRPFTKRGISGQDSGIKELKGGSQALADPLENVFSNMQRLIDASLRNRAMQQVVDGVGEEAMTPAREGDRDGDDVVRVMRDGRAEYYHVRDPALVRALGGLNPGAIANLGAFRAFKRMLTLGVTADPAFIARNFARDMMQAWLTDKNSLKFGVDSMKGAADTLRSLRDPDNADVALQTMAFSGASFIGGHAYGNDPKERAAALRRALRGKGLSSAQADSFMGSIVGTAEHWWGMYRELGDAAENANRMAVYKAAIAAGKSPLEAVYDSKDLMDFSLSGNFTFVRVMSDMLPFFNARLQGLYKLGRAAQENPTRLAQRGAIVAAATLALVAANSGNDDYDQLPGWEKDLYWHIFMPGGRHLRIPKPFELGIMFGTIPERMFRAGAGYDSLSDTKQALTRNIGQVLAFDPTPQIINPALETYMNWDKFRDAPIENMGDQQRLPGDRYSSFTSPTMVGIGEALNISPKKLEHLWGGYLGTLGMYVLGASDMVVRHAQGDVAPARTMNDIPVLSSFLRNSNQPASSTKYGGEFYEAMNQANQVYSTIRDYQKSGRFEDAQRLIQENRGLLNSRKVLTRSQTALGKIRKQMDGVRNDRSLSRDTKRQRLDDLQKMVNRIEERAVREANDRKGAG